ncbi:MAG: Fmu (Sun) domain-containing protein [Chitinophagaceae bacterium]
MSRWTAYLNTSKIIIEDYNGRIPLSTWLKDFFRQHKQMGSKDRKIISQAVYSFYRLGHSINSLSLEEKILIGLFLCNRSSNELLASFKPLWNDSISISLPEKAAFLEKESVYWIADAVFPWQGELSSKVDKDLFGLSHLQQPDLFLRVRPHQQETVSLKLTGAGIPFTKLIDNCIVLANATKIDELLQVDEEVVIQDYNSQRVGDFFNLQNKQSGQQTITLWDCCAGSGGKSIMAYDLNPEIKLTVSDSRVSILQNLKQRFQHAGVTKYNSYVTDLSVSGSTMPPGKFEYIIADVPCSGSGTWARTPEQLYFFDPGKISYYNDLQEKIISQIIPKLKDLGRLIYVTCSIFSKENEGMVNFIQKNFGLQLEIMEILTGYEMKADTMFVAVFKKV